MNYNQIYKKIIDWYVAEEPRLLVGEYDGKVGFTDSFLVYLLPKDKIPFDVGRFREIDLETALKPSKTLYPIEDTGYVREYEKEKLRIFEREDGKQTHINQKYLTHFKGCDFEQGRENEPVFIYKLGELQGLVFPVIVRE